MPITAGTVLGRYRLLERAGVGGMSEVWKAEDGTLKRTVAVKVILGPVAADSTFRERFLREARLVAGLEHPNVLPVFDYGTANVDGDDVSYLVMPLVAGGSLKGRVSGPVPPALAVTWLAAIASALDHAHAKGILHRDVKPGNVLMDSQGRPLLADFGLARSAEVSSGLTATGTVLGTPLYMAPEQATGSPLDGRADQYALAVIAFELLAGRVPFSADSPLGVLHQHVAAPPPPLSSVLPGTAPAVDAVLGRGMAKKSADRFASCGEFVAALGSALGVPGAAATAPLPARDESQQATVVSAQALGPGALAAPASTRVTAPGQTRRVASILAALLLLSAGGGIFLLVRGTGAGRATTSAGALAPSGDVPRVKEPEPTAAPALTTSAESAALPGISSKVGEAPVAGTASAANEPRPNSPFEENSAASRDAAGNTKRVGGAQHPSPFEENSTGTLRSAGGTKRGSPAHPPVPKQNPLPPLLSGAAHSGDTQLSPAWDALDNARRTGGRLAREDFVGAMGTARAVLAGRPTAEAQFLDSFSRAGVAFADGRDAEAWQLLTRALDGAGPAANSRTLRFVEEEVRALGPNPGPDAGWVMGLAFADVRGDLADELAKAEERAPRSARVREARALAGGR